MTSSQTPCITHGDSRPPGIQEHSRGLLGGSKPSNTVAPVRCPARDFSWPHGRGAARHAPCARSVYAGSPAGGRHNTVWRCWCLASPASSLPWVALVATISRETMQTQLPAPVRQGRRTRVRPIDAAAVDDHDSWLPCHCSARGRKRRYVACVPTRHVTAARAALPDGCQITDPCGGPHPLMLASRSLGGTSGDPLALGVSVYGRIGHG
jgi:hypothetical protein